MKIFKYQISRGHIPVGHIPCFDLMGHSTDHQILTVKRWKHGKIIYIIGELTFWTLWGTLLQIFSFFTNSAAEEHFARSLLAQCYHFKSAYFQGIDQHIWMYCRFPWMDPEKIFKKKPLHFCSMQVIHTIEEELQK